MELTLTPSSVRPADLLRGYSLEMTAKDVDALNAAALIIPAGTRISVTFLPGEAQAKRIAAAQAVKMHGLVPVPHISARRLASEEELCELLGALQTDVGVEQCFVVAGDPPVPAGPYEDAMAIIRSGLLQKYGIRKVGIGGYPEGHPDISQEALWQALLDKSAALKSAGLDAEIVTQFGFDAEPVLHWLDRLRDAGIDAPVRVGLPGPASVKTLLRFAGRCGVSASTAVLRKYGISVTRLLGTSGPDRLLANLEAELAPARHGDVGIHFYPFGGLQTTVEWAQGARR
ncbi:MAG TPA: methylenetetrahydrofolate reductase [Sphingobium sp.]|nr:methylenetetrahydrofolate reductase [Sphingobium sp.]